MATLKGQNLRVFNGTTVIAMSTNATITLTNNTEESSHKDIVGFASQPTVMSQGWSVQVESLDVSDVATLLTAIKNQTKFNLMWDETSTTDNYSMVGADFARSGQAYLNDATFTFDDRTNSVKNIQFTGVGAINKLSGTISVGGGNTNSFTKGQFVRLFLSSDNTAAPSKVIGAAKQLSLHVSLQLEDATTKDTEGTFLIQEPVGLSYDISTTALVRSGDTISSDVHAQDLASIEEIYEAGTPVKWKIANTSGANNRTAGTVICSGSALIQTLTINAPNRQNATYSAQLAGYGAYTVGS